MTLPAGTDRVIKLVRARIRARGLRDKPINTGILLLAAMLFAPPAWAIDSLPWSTTFNCEDWQQPNTLTCDTIVKYGDWTCDASHPDQITAAANMSVGTGGKGYRHFKGPGHNQNGGGVAFSTPTMPEFWIRYYLRYPIGFDISNRKDGNWYDKQVYLNYGGPGMGAFETDLMQHKWLYRGHRYKMGAGSGFYPVNGNQMHGDGLWHYYEWHINVNTNVIQLWIDGVYKGSAGTDEKGNTWRGFGGVSGYNSFTIGSNQDTNSSSGCQGVDYDEIAISTTGYIGPVNASPDTTPPSGVRASGIGTWE